METDLNNSENVIIQRAIDLASEMYYKSGEEYDDFNSASKVAVQSQKIGNEIGLTLLEQETLIVASWLSYTRKIELVDAFLVSEKYVEAHKVLDVIKSISLNKEPISNLEKVFKDAYSSYFGETNFLKREEDQRKKLADSGVVFSDLVWYEKILSKIIKHKFYTIYAQENLSKTKEENKQKVVKLIKKLQKMQDAELEKELKIDAGELKDLKKKLSKIENRSERGVETLYRLASKNLYTRLTMVDNKGNILISINAIIISLTIGSVMARLEEDPHLLFPVILLLVTNLGSILFAILATRPPKTKGVFNKDEITSDKANLLSFDNFFNMTREDYHKNMDFVANNADALYSNITEDIYMMGRRLGHKYHYLRYSYNIFLYGLMAAVFGFLICHIMFEI